MYQRWEHYIPLLILAEADHSGKELAQHRQLARYLPNNK